MAFYRKDHGYVDSIGNNPILNLLTGEEIGRTLIAKDDINDREELWWPRLAAASGNRRSFDPATRRSPRISIPARAVSLTSIRTRSSRSMAVLCSRAINREPTHIKYRVYNGTADWDLGFANLFVLDSLFDIQ